MLRHDFDKFVKRKLKLSRTLVVGACRFWLISSIN